MASATSFRFVMRHLAPSRTSEARFCSRAVARGLRRASAIAAMRLLASCRLIFSKDVVFTQFTHTTFTARVKVPQNHLARSPMTLRICPPREIFCPPAQSL